MIYKGAGDNVSDKDKQELERECRYYLTKLDAREQILKYKDIIWS